jgi:uncharacterized RDD family membrane protein YckC
MDWYYIIDGQTYGPISGTDLDEFVQTGKIQIHTLVWREGMTDWKPYHTAFSATAPATENPTEPQNKSKGEEWENTECASVLERGGAKILDAILLAIVMVGLVFVSRLVSQAMYSNGAARETVSAFGAIMMMATLSLPLLYNFMMLANGGATIGKKVLGIKVDNENGQPLGYGESFLRCIVETGCFLAAVGLGVLIFYGIFSEIRGEENPPTTMQVCLPACLLGVLPYLPALFTSDKRATHDFVFAKTKVIRAR